MIATLKKKLRREKKPLNPFRADARTYALHGDNVWGNSITWMASTGEHSGRVVGWVPQRPRIGDRLLVKMQSGKWAAWAFVKVDPAHEVDDMFFANVTGGHEYVEEADVPRHAYAGGVIAV